MAYVNLGARLEAPGGFPKIYDKILEGQTTDDVIQLAPDAVYLIVSQEITISTGRIYGCRAFIASTPEASAFDTHAGTRISLGSTENVGISSSINSGGLYKWRCASSAYRVRLIVYRLG